MHCRETPSPTARLASLVRGSTARGVPLASSVSIQQFAFSISTAAAQHSARIHVPYAAMLYRKHQWNKCKREDFDGFRKIYD